MIVLAYVAYWTGTTNLFIVPARQASKADKINSLVSIPGLLKRLKIQAQKSVVEDSKKQ